MMHFEEWNAALRKCCGEFQGNPSGKNSSDHKFEVGALFGLDVARVGCSVRDIDRNRKGILRDDAEHLFLLHQVQGTTGVSHAGKDELLGAGDFLLLDSTRPCTLGFNGKKSEFVSVHLPRSMFLMDRGQIPNVGKRVQRNHPLHAGLKNLVVGHDEVDQAAFLSEYLFDFVTMVFGPDEEQNTVGRFRDSQGRMKFIEDNIDKHLTSSDFSINYLAKQIGVSRRSLQREFSENDTTFTQTIQKRRLQHFTAAKLQMERLGRPASIAQIAHGSGFGDQAHFNRIFKRHYNQSPSDYFSGIGAQQ